MQLGYFFRTVYCSLRGVPVLGIWEAGKFFTAAYSKGVIRIKPKNYRQPLILRGSTSDVETFFSIIIRSSYPQSEKNVKIIVDAGANVGYSAVYFAQIYPDAKIYALEPETENYRILVENSTKYPNIVPLNCALWSRSEMLYLQDESAEPWAFQFGNDQLSEKMTKAYSLPDLMDEFKIAEIDILKVDIEGAEKEVFSGNTNWLNKVKTIYVEIHDRFVKGAAAQIFKVLTKYTYDFEVRFEYVILDNLESIAKNPEPDRLK